MKQPRAPSLDQLRRYAIARTFFAPTNLQRAIERLGFLQADPIRAPARAQDLTLRHRVKGYCAGDLERRYPTLAIEEDFFINYGFLPRVSYALMHPRTARHAWTAQQRRRARDLFEFVQANGEVHPRQVEAHFAHGSVTNYWGGVSSATTHLLDGMHYRGLLRVARRESGIRIYAVAEHQAESRVDPVSRRARVDSLVDLVVHAYAPVPRPSLVSLIMRLRFAVPQWRGELKAAIARAKQRLARVQVDGVEYYLPADERPASPRHRTEERVRLLAPFDPLVWDRRRFELLWGWAYRFEAYTPAPKRKLGYYALPLLFRERVIGWANVTARQGSGTLEHSLGFVASRPREPAFALELEAELERLRSFLGHDVPAAPTAAG